MGVFHYFSCYGDVILKAFLGSVYHDRLKSGIDGGFDNVHVFGMIQMKGGLSLIPAVYLIKTVGEFLCCHIKPIKFIGGYLYNDWRLCLLGTLQNRINQVCIPGGKRADSISSFFCRLKHLCYRY